MIERKARVLGMKHFSSMRLRARQGIIAATIIMLDDDGRETKCRALGEDLVLTKDQRVSLWARVCAIRLVLGV